MLSTGYKKLSKHYKDQNYIAIPAAAQRHRFAIVHQYCDPRSRRVATATAVF